MLQMMRKHAGNWMIKILLGAIALAFALSWGAYNYGGEPPRLAVKINGESIAEARVSDTYNNLVEQSKQRFGAQFDQIAPLLNLRQQALNTIVDQVLLNQAANQMAVRVSNQEVAIQVASTPAFQVNGRFDERYYRRLLERNRLAPETYEASVRQELRMAKLAALVAGAGQVTPLQVDQVLAGQLAQVKGVYLLFKPEDYKKEVKTTDQQLQDYYKKNLASYMNPAMVVFDYVVFPVAAQRDQVQVTDQDVSDTYDMERDRYAKPEQVGASHILIKLPEKPSEAEVAEGKAEAEKIMALAKKKGADFAALAKKYSQGPSAAQGGELGKFKRGAMVPEFEKLAFSLKPGEVGLVRTKFGWHVIKVNSHDQATVTPLEQVKGEIRKRLTERQAKDMAQAAAERAFDRLAMGESLESLAKENNTSVQNSPKVAQGQKVEGLPGLKDFFAAAQDLEAGQPVPALTFDNGSILAVIKQRIPAQAKPFKQVEEDVRAAVVAGMAEVKAKAEAAKMLGDLAGVKEPAKELARIPGAKQTDWLKKGAQIKDLSGSGGLVHALFLRPEIKPVLTAPVTVNGAFAAGVLAERKPATEQEIKDKREQFNEILLSQERRQMVQAFLGDLRAAAEILVPVQGKSESPIPGCDSRSTIIWVPMGSPEAAGAGK
ncbi:MAG: SurA N-terminal domain-containing protein [Desulfarculaceae bacterium]|nr:SurA N-terminal domain-containing protein [Desulfarculaceae bacterium]MCF8074108.1 SurA N-terminal domain-containing protein [Desulfarculaceae bacterium]MCF8103769.1 SurA N-terminal domain-containing protein [Desulfarculaceae bacterium]MCF8116842.1 SurA N-terminal domain-containing protein [Desulfarculaceae bacterium]